MAAVRTACEENPVVFYWPEGFIVLCLTGHSKLHVKKTLKASLYLFMVGVVAVRTASEGKWNLAWHIVFRNVEVRVEASMRMFMYCIELLKYWNVGIRRIHCQSSSSRSPTGPVQQHRWSWWSSTGPPSPHIRSVSTTYCYTKLHGNIDQILWKETCNNVINTKSQFSTSLLLYRIHKLSTTLFLHE